MEYIQESRQTPVAGACDVLVAGGGVAGISAALSAARAGASVVLLERGFLLGGLATAGLITFYLPLDDGMGRQVSFGLAHELLLLAITHGIENAEHSFPSLWLQNHSVRERCEGKRFESQFNPSVFALACERLLLREGVRILYGTVVCDVHKRDSLLDAVIVESKSGRQAIRAGAVVDATGDADVCAYALAPTAIHGKGNVLAAWYYGLKPGDTQARVVALGAADTPDGQGDAPVPLLNRRFTGLDGQEISEMVCLSHAQTWEHLQKTQKSVDGFTVTALPSIPQLRMTRRLVGEYTLDTAQDHQSFEDSVGMIGDWRRRGPCYQIPLRALYSRAVPNLFSAGRCISTTDAMWDISRVIPPCAVTGEAAGAAAALYSAGNALCAAQVQSLLRRRGIPTGFEALCKEGE